MRSLTKQDRTIQIGDYLIIPKPNGFWARGCTPDRKGMKFTLKEAGPGRWDLSGNRPDKSRLRVRIEALRLEEAVETADKALFGNEEVPILVNASISEALDGWLGSLDCGGVNRADYKRSIRFFKDWAKSKGLEDWKDLRLEHLQAYVNYHSRKGKVKRTIILYTLPVRAAAKWWALNHPMEYRDFSFGLRMPNGKKEYRYQDQMLRKFLSLEEVADFLLWLRDQPKGKRIIPGVALQGLAGLRVLEALRLTLGQVDLENEWVTVEGEVKNAASVRRLPVCKLLAEILRETLTKGDRLLSSYSDYTAYSSMVRDHLDKWKSGNGIEPRGLRRTLPSEAAKRGWSLYAVGRYLGHSPKSITERHYVALGEGHLEKLFRDEVVAKLDAILPNWGAKRQQNDNIEDRNATN